MRILVDVDGIITDTLPAWLKRIHETTGVKAKVSDITKWNLNECPPLDQVPVADLMAPLNEPGFTAHLPMMADADIFLKKLHDAGHDVNVVTARHGIVCTAETLQWFKAMMPWFDSSQKLWFLRDKHLMAADVLIDDKVENLAAYKKAHPKAHLITISYPYNTHAPLETRRIHKDGYEWEAIESYIRNKL